MNNTVALLFALAVSVPIAGLIIMWLLNLITRAFDIDKGVPWLFYWLGIIERIIFFYAIYKERWEIIAGWFVLKALAKFEGKPLAIDQIKTFYAFLIGCGLSLIFAGSGVFLYRWLLTLPLTNCTCPH